MIYTLSWLPSIAFLGVLMMFLIVTVLALAAVIVAVLFALAIILTLALALARSSFLAVRAARSHWPRLGRAGEPALAPPVLEAAPRPAPLVNPRPHRVP